MSAAPGSAVARLSPGPLWAEPLWAEPLWAEPQWAGAAADAAARGLPAARGGLEPVRVRNKPTSAPLGHPDRTRGRNWDHVYLDNYTHQDRAVLEYGAALPARGASARHRAGSSRKRWRRRPGRRAPLGEPKRCSPAGPQEGLQDAAGQGRARAQSSAALAYDETTTARTIRATSWACCPARAASRAESASRWRPRPAWPARTTWSPSTSPQGAALARATPDTPPKRTTQCFALVETLGGV